MKFVIFILCSLLFRSGLSQHEEYEEEETTTEFFEETTEESQSTTTGQPIQSSSQTNFASKSTIENSIPTLSVVEPIDHGINASNVTIVNIVSATTETINEENGTTSIGSTSTEDGEINELSNPNSFANNNKQFINGRQV